jgi:membrane fusion protein (multidrug efflux system)
MRRSASFRAALIAAPLLVALAGLAACEKKEQAAAPPPAPPAVIVAKVVRSEVTPSSTFTGRIEAVDKVDLRARVSGFIEKQLFTEGADIKAGELMFTLEKDEYEAQVNLTKATISRAEAALQLADIETGRQTQLVKKEVKAQSTLDVALAEQAQSRADVERQKAELQKAELDLKYTDIVSPISGRVGRAVFSVGDFVGPDSGTLTTIVSQDPIYVTFPVSQRELLQVRREAQAAGTDPRNVTVKVRLADNTVFEHAGKLNFVDVAVSTSTDTVAVRAELPNPDRLLVDGQLVTAIVESSEPESVLQIPVAAVQIDQAGRYVLVVDKEKKVEVRRVEIDRVHEGNIVITKGLEEGESVITEGIQKVRPQQVVQPTEATGQAPTS